MANIKITDLTAYTDAASTDVLPIVDVGADVTKKITIGDVVKAVPLGTAALPGLAFDGDPNSGVYSPGADQVAISTGGTGRLFVDASGDVSLPRASGGYMFQTSGSIRAGIRSNDNNELLFNRGTDSTGMVLTATGVGIGTTSPGYKCDIDVTGSALRLNSTTNQALLVISSDDAANAKIEFGDETDNDRGAITYDNPNNALIFQANAAERLRIDSSGKLLVGTSSTSANASAVFQANSVSSTGAGVVHIARGSTFTAADTNIGNLEFTDSSGNIFGRINCTSDATVTAGSDHPGRLVFSTTADGAASPTERLRIDSSGNVGLGTSSPYQKLHVSDATSANIYLETRNSAIGSTAGIYFKTNTSGLNDYYKSAIALEDDGTTFARGKLHVLQNNSGDSSNATLADSVVTITQSGNVGIGTSNPQEQFVISNDGAEGIEFATAAATNTNVIQNYNRSTSAYSSLRFDAASYAFRIGTSEKVTIDSSGRLLVGTSTSDATLGSLLQVVGSGVNSSPLFYRPENNTVGPRIYLAKSRGSTLSSKTIVQSDDDLGAIQFRGADGSIDAIAAQIAAFVDGTPGANDMPGRLVFSTTADGASSPTSRFRIDSSGRIDHFASDNVGHELHTSSTGASDEVYRIRNGATDLDNGTTVMKILADGDLENTNNSYGAISDIKLKENVVDATSQWGDLKSLQVRKYNFKEETGYGTHTQIGLIAQEVELVSPGLVSESPDLDEDGNDLGTVTKSVNYSVLYMKAVKALQEAMERIEVLEQRLTDAGIA